MRLFQTGELKLLKEVRERFRLDQARGVVVGIGDDAAVIAPQGKQIIVTTDMMNEGVHFDLGYTSPFQLGFKLVSVNVSDIMAMGGTPRYLFLDLAFTRDADDAFFRGVYDGIDLAMSMYGISLLGGDLCSARNDTVLSATVMGEGDRIVTRAGALPGDKIYITSSTGDSACGLEILRRLEEPDKEKIRKVLGAYCNTPPCEIEDMAVNVNGKVHKIKFKSAEPLLRRHLMPVARDARDLAPHASSMLDVSDGLFIDLCRICDESEAGAVVYEEKVPLSCELREVSALLGLDPFHLAASGGEDYELLFTSRSFPVEEYNRTHDIKISCIGEITRQERNVITGSGKRIPLKAEGYQHFGPPG